MNGSRCISIPKIKKIPAAAMNIEFAIAYQGAIGEKQTIYADALRRHGFPPQSAM
jgi:hypothetical protein